MPVALELPSSAGALYDPYAKAVLPTDAGRAMDGDASTSFTVGSSAANWAVGYAIDVQKLRRLRALELITSSPGFRVEVYATDLATPPPTITDARWAHLRNVESVKRDQQIDLTSDAGAKYRTVLLWITKGPSSGDRVRLGEITVFG